MDIVRRLFFLRNRSYASFSTCTADGDHSTGKLITLLYMEYLSLWFLRLSVLVDLFFFFAIILQIGHRIHIYLIKRRLASVFYR